MVKLNNTFNAFASCYLLLLQVYSGWCQQTLAKAVVQIFKGNEYRCAGTLIRNNFVLTAAHCLGEEIVTTDVSVLAGASIDGNVSVRSAVSHKFVPDKNNLIAKDMNIAVLKLEKSVAGPNIQVASMLSYSMAKWR
ncbi:Chymotrypsin-like elastase family member 1 [Eumeta japonica]|uniref:Chymotrypsin-like elastase family member 1 n=1 Tax=Eumeta variegata TaxID=151549 RepID=A0A4C1T181_EUMVA|nr:Chymotrypsin-like elastase family member 1 [Eumeta japonica]